MTIMTNISEKTSVSIRLIFVFIAVFVPVVGFGWTAIQKIETVASEVRSIKMEMRDQYTLSAAAEVALRNAMANPGTRFADPRNPGTYFVVESGGIIRKPAEVE